MRAKFNLVYLVVLLLISPLYLFVDFPTFFAITLVWAATFSTLTVTTLISKYRRFGTEFTLVANIIARGLLMNFIMKHQQTLECKSMFLEFTRRYIVHFFFLTDIVSFRTNIFISCFVATPLFIFIGGLNNQFDQTHPLPFCPNKDSLKVYYAKLLLYIPLVVPVLFCVYLQGINELRLFIWSENNSKQQQTVLEIFERQQEGVVLLKQAMQGADSDKP